MQAGVSGITSDLNDLSSRTQEMISRDHKFGGSSKQNSEKCSSSLSAIHSNESVVILKVVTLYLTLSHFYFRVPWKSDLPVQALCFEDFTLS